MHMKAVKSKVVRHDYQYNLAQAARILGITRQRAQQLVHAQLLEAQDISIMGGCGLDGHYHKWKISASSIQERLDWMRSVGREVSA
jgi:hypothetical protein